MGGRALKSVETIRLPAAKYYEIETAVINDLTHFPCGGRYGKVITPIRRIQAYRQKADFGDLDLVCGGFKPDNQAFEAYLKSWCETRETFFNGNIVSFDLPVTDFLLPGQEGKSFQVDLIFVSEHLVDIAADYFAWNDLGNLVGRVAHKMGLKFGWQGLVYLHKINNRDMGEIVLSTKMEEILPFLGYDFATWQKGFDTLEEVYRYVTSSTYFNPSMFHLDNLNAINRIRNRKRPTYTQFLEWLDGREGLPAYKWDADKSVYFPMIRQAFPSFDVQHKHLLEEVERRERMATKFNGGIVMEETNLSGAALGAFISRFKSRWLDESLFWRWVDECPTEEIRDLIREEAATMRAVKVQ